MINTNPKRAKCTDCQIMTYPELCSRCKAYLCDKCVNYLMGKVYCKGCFVDLMTNETISEDY